MTQKKERPIFLHEKMPFGLYQALSIQEVFTGPSHFPDIYIRELITLLIKELYELEFQPLQTKHSNVFSIGFEGRYLKMQLLKEDDEWVYYNGYNPDSLDYHQHLSTFFNSRFGAIWQPYNPGIVDYNNIVNRQVFDDCDRLTLTRGTPEYIAWAIKNNSYFFLRPTDISRLESFEVYTLAGLKLIPLHEHYFLPEPIITKRKFEFPGQAAVANEAKWESWKNSVSRRPPISEEEIEYKQQSYPWDEEYGDYLNELFNS